METNDFQGTPDLSDLFLPPADFDPFKAGNDALRTRRKPEEVEYDLSEVEELYGGIGIGDYGNALVGGAMDVMAATLEGGAAMYGSVSGDYSLARNMARYRRHMDDAITGDIPEELKQKFSYKAVTAISQMPFYMALGMGTVASGGTAGAAALALRGASWTGLGSNAYQQGRDDYIATIGATGRDLTDEEMRAANNEGAKTMIPLMVLERVGANTLVNSIFRGTAGRATVGDITKRLVKAPLAEAGTEGTQTLYQNFLAAELSGYDPDRPINQGVVESMLLGAIASGSFSTPANLVQMRAEKLAENIDSGNINAEEMADELGRSLMGAGMDADSIPATGSDESKIRHTRGATMKFIDSVLTPLTTKVSKAGMEYKRAFRDFERRTGVQQGKAKEVITPFIEKMKKLNKISQEDYDTLSNALANVGIINKGNQTELDAVDSPQANEEVSTAELKENDTFEVDTSMPVGATATETRVIDGVKTERKTRGLTQEEADGGLSPEIVTQKISIINQQASNAQKALQEIVPDLKVNVYATQQEFQDATGVDASANRGAYKDGVVNINATLATKDTLGHEVFHAALLSNSETAQQARDTSALFLNSISRSSKNDKLMAYAKRFSETYDPSVRNEEALAEMFGVMSATYSTLDISAKTRVKAFVAQLADMLGISGLFNEATTDKQIIDAFNTLSSSVANGTTTIEGIKILRGSGIVGTSGTESQQRFQANYFDRFTGLSYKYKKNTEDFKKLAENYITKDKSLLDFDGVPMHMHVPDGAFTGSIEHKGKTIAEGGGGLFFPTEFHDDGVFWASTPNAAKSMADQLNAQIDPSETARDGKIRMALMTSNIDKAFSSIQGTTNAIRLINHVQEVVSPENKAKVQKILLDAVIKASNAKGISRKIKTDKDGEPLLDKSGKKIYEDKKVSLNVGNINKGETDPMKAINKIVDFINQKNSKTSAEGVKTVLDNRTFLDRKFFVEQFVKEVTNKANYSMTAIPADYEFRRELQQALKELTITSSKMRMYSEKYKIKGANEGTHAINQQILNGLAYSLNEPMIRDQFKDPKTEGIGIANGSAYAVIEIEGKVEAFEMLNKDGTQKHESYRYGIRSVDGNKATMHLLRDRINPLDVYELMGRTRIKGKENAFKKEIKGRDSFLPTSGFSGLNYGVNMLPAQTKQFKTKKFASKQTGLFEGYEGRPEGAVPKSAKLPKGAPYTVEFNVGKGDNREVKSVTVNAIDENIAKAMARDVIGKQEKEGTLIRQKSITRGEELRLQKVGFQNENELDKKYLSAVKSKNEKELRKLVTEAAVNNGFMPTVVYNGSRDGEFNYYSPDMDNRRAPYSAGMLFSSDRSVSENFGIVREHYVRLKNPINTDSPEGMLLLRNLLQKGDDTLGETWDTRGVPDMADNFGYGALWVSNNTEYDGVVHSATDTMGGKLSGSGDSTTYGIFDPKNIRSADLITRDDNGEIIPLSQRFAEGVVQEDFQPAERDKFKSKEVKDQRAKDYGQDFRYQKSPNETHEQALARILDKHNMQKEFDGVRKLLNYLYASGRDAGMDVSYMEQYFPRMVKDLAGLQDSYKGVYYDNEIERELDMYAKKKFDGRELDPVERQVFLENLAKNKILKRGAGGVNQNAVNKRVVKVLDEDRQKKFYASPEEALDTYVESMISSINQVKLIGTARMEKGKRVQSGLLGQMLDADLQRGTLSNEGLKIVQDAVEARFGMHGQQHGFIRGAKNAGYIAAMGNIGSAITQLGDFYFSAVQNGLVNTVEAGLSKKTLSRQDVMGMKNLVTIEAKDGGKSFQKAVDFVFKASGITAIDGLAKDTNINAALLDMRKRATKSKDSRAFQKLQKELSQYQGRDSAQTIADIRNGVNSDLVLEALYNRLSNVAPISLSEMPESYNRNPNARIIYSLKSYTIKQFDFIRQESFNKMGNSKTFAEGVTQLMRIATLAMVANGSADVLKAILFNREIDEEDLVWNNILRMFGVTKYTTVKARQEGLGDALLKTIAPPQFGMLDDFSKDFDKAVSEGTFDIDELRSVKYIPFLGKLYYWREGRGKDVEKRLSRLKD